MKVYKNIVFNNFDNGSDIKKDNLIIEKDLYTLHNRFDPIRIPFGSVIIRIEGNKLIGDITVKDEEYFDDRLYPVIGYKCERGKRDKFTLTALGLSYDNIDPLIKSIKEQANEN